MAQGKFALFAILLFLAIPLAGCTEQAGGEREEIESETLVEVANPCSLPSESVQQSMISIDVDGTERFFRLTVPESDAGARLPLLLAFHGGDGAEEDFPQQDEFDALAGFEKFIVAYPISESSRTVSGLSLIHI